MGTFEAAPQGGDTPAAENTPAELRETLTELRGRIGQEDWRGVWGKLKQMRADVTAAAEGTGDLINTENLQLDTDLGERMEDLAKQNEEDPSKMEVITRTMSQYADMIEERLAELEKVEGGEAEDAEDYREAA